MTTPLDRAHAAMAAAPDDPAPRLRWYGALAGTELVLLLARETGGERIAPRIFELDAGPVVLAFDSETRLTAFTGAAVPYAALPGRDLAALLAGQGLGLGVNLGTDHSELLPPAAVDWWAATLAPEPEALEIRPEAVTAPRDLPAPLIAALDARLAAAAGLAAGAVLAGLRQADGSETLLLAVIEPRPGAEPALARAIAEALRFSGLEAAALDLAFLGADHPAAEVLSRCGLRIDLPDPAPEPLPPRDPAAPPRLR